MDLFSHNQEFCLLEYILNKPNCKFKEINPEEFYQPAGWNLEGNFYEDTCCTLYFLNGKAQLQFCLPKGWLTISLYLLLAHWNIFTVF